MTCPCLEAWWRPTRRFSVLDGGTFIAGSGSLGGSTSAAKAIVAGIYCRDTGEIRAEVVGGRRKSHLVPFVRKSARTGSTLYTDDLKSYQNIEGYEHESVVHSDGEYVRGGADGVHTNSVESFWDKLKGGYRGTYRYLSNKHMQRYVDEFAGRQTGRDDGTLVQLVMLAKAMVGKRLRWKDLTG